MKKFYLILISLAFIFNTNAQQCFFNTQIFPQNSCDTICNSFFEVSSATGPGNYYLFINGSFHSQFVTSASVGPVCPNAIYDIMVTDSVNCNFMDSIWVGTISGLSISSLVTNPSCGSCTNGAITISVTGGAPPYTFLWSNGATVQNLQGLPAGVYTVTVTDANGCTQIQNFAVNPSCSFTPQIIPQTTCDTICNSIAFYVSNGGFGPHYLFVNGGFVTMFTSAGTIGNLCPGVLYNVLITDSAGCTFTDSIFINPLPPMTGAISSQPPSCPGCNDGFAVLTVTGGTPPYSYNWSNGANTPQISGLTAGIYCVYITDAMGCTITLCDTLASLTGSGLIGGIVFLDIDTNGIKNNPEPNLSNIQIEVNPGGFTTWTSINGTYFILVPNGTYDVSVIAPANWQQTSLPLMYNLTVNDNVYLGNDFGLLPDTATPSANVYITAGIPRCNWSSYYQINYENTGLMLAQGEIIFTLAPQVTFVSAIPPPANISGNIYTWTFDSLYPYVMQQIHINVTMPPTAGTVLNSSAIINLHDNLQNVIFSDTVFKTQTVTCSYDPNDKLALPEGIGSQNAVPLNSELDFTIRFQNTGTDTAFVVVIKDTLASDLDLSTFEIIASSHEVYAQMDPGGILTFTFDNILLPDSNVNEPMSHGFVRYRIRPIAPVTDPTVITNTAYIFFDQNPAVVTNTTLTTLSDNLLSVVEINGSGIINAYPNPFSDEVVIQFERNFTGKAQLYDYQGKLVKNYLYINKSSFVMKRENLKAGIYLLKLTNDESNATLKLIVK